MIEKKQNRKGSTTITSVSLSDEFKGIMDKYELSPTDTMRKGIAVQLYELGVERYNTPRNRERYDHVKLKELETKIIFLIKELNNLLEELNNV